MGAETTGRKLGIGLRLAARALQQRAGESAPSGAAHNTLSASVPSAAKSKARAVAQGTRKFGEAVWGPMAHTGSVLWLEITGLFFALFALFFAQNVYKFRASVKAGPDHIHFLVYSALTFLFAAFTFSQFYKARKKERKNRARRAA
jgi:hypothetical protein